MKDRLVTSGGTLILMTKPEAEHILRELRMLVYFYAGIGCNLLTCHFERVVLNVLNIEQREQKTKLLVTFRR